MILQDEMPTRQKILPLIPFFSRITPSLERTTCIRLSVTLAVLDTRKHPQNRSPILLPKGLSAFRVKSNDNSHALSPSLP